MADVSEDGKIIDEFRVLMEKALLAKDMSMKAASK